MRFTVLLLALFACLAFSAPAFAGSSTATGPNISVGIPVVTNQQAEAKIYRVTSKFYDLARAVAPELTLVFLIVAGFLAIFFKEAKKAIIVIVGVLILILWGPQMIGWFTHILKA